MTKNRARKIASRRLAVQNHISYTEAARLLDDERALRQLREGTGLGAHEYAGRLAEEKEQC